jgi:hypothetical protein
MARNDTTAIARKKRFGKGPPAQESLGLVYILIGRKEISCNIISKIIIYDEPNAPS